MPGPGSCSACVSVLLVAWMVAVPLASSPYPSLASAASHSTIVRGVDDVMPDDVRTLYSSLRNYLDRSGFPPVFGDLPDAPIVGVPGAGLRPRAEAHGTGRRRCSRPWSRSTATRSQCDRRTEGTGFVYATDRIMTNAHVVAGSTHVSVQIWAGHCGRLRSCSTTRSRDVAVLRVRDLDRRPLPFAPRAGHDR